MSGTDKYGDGCAWYNEHAELGYDVCGKYDSDTWSSSTACCGCGGGNRPDEPTTCVDGDGKDIGGDGCEWYSNNVSFCGAFDSETFKAVSQCCACV